MIVDTETDKDNPAKYSSNWRYLSDEMERLDLLLHLGFQKEESAGQNPLKGLVLPKEEIEDLLTGAGKSMPGQNCKDDATVLASIQLEKKILERRAASLRYNINLPLPRLSRLFNLTRFEERCLLICLAPEIDRKYEKIYAYLQDDLTCKSPCVDLLISLSCDTAEDRLSARNAFEPGSRLLKHRLLLPIDNPSNISATLLSQSFKLDERIAGFLLGSTALDAHLESVADLVSAEGCKPDLCVAEEARRRIGKIINFHASQSQSAESKAIFYLFGPYGSGKRSVAKAACYDLGLDLITCDAASLLRNQTSFDELAFRLGREAGLHPAALCLENVDCLFEGSDTRFLSLLEAIRANSAVTFLLGGRYWMPQGLVDQDMFIQIELRAPDYAMRKSIWEHYLKCENHALEKSDLQAVCSRFRFTQGQIRDALADARTRANWRSPDAPRLAIDDLFAACRSQSTLKIDSYARKVEPQYGWHELILPQDEIDQLGELCEQARQREKVYGEWGFNRKLSLGKGINALFFGPPGTGKTMAAEVIANELQLDLYKIDLSQIVSKYIGETEKNLHQIFKQAEASDAILFFDEADALFGKRSEVKDAHDRYANIEIAYLLQKMEEYNGIAILATNLRQNLDDAFVRRLRFIIEFPFPDEEYRRRIWEVTFPKEAPLAPDVDFPRLAREIRLAGGNIRNIAVAAAFYAARDGSVIQMAQLMRAAHREHRKVGRIWNPT